MDSDKDKTTEDASTAPVEGIENSPGNELAPAQDTLTPENTGEITSSQPSAVEETAPAAPPAAPPETAAKRGTGHIALVLAVVACVASAYLWYRQEVQGRHQQELTAANLSGELKGVSEGARALEKQQDRLSEAQEKILSRQDELASLVQEKLETSVSTLQEKLEGSVSTLQQQQDALTGSVSKIYESMDRSIDSWALEEVEQLLRMANHSVSLAGDIENGIIALNFADSRLAELGNPELLDVRRLIAEELGQLKALERIDLPGLAFRLAGLSSTVDKLPLINKPSRPGASETGDGNQAEEENMWMQAGYELLDDLKGLVRIQNVAEPAKPLLAPEQRYFLTGNLRLLLSGAQIAVLRADTNTFKANLEQAAQILTDYFDTGEQSVKSVLTELQAMSGEKLAAERPDVSGSIAKLKDIKTQVAAQ